MESIIKSQFLSLYCMVLADGVIDARELEMLYKIGIEQYGLTQDEITKTIKEAGTSFVIPDTLTGKIRILHNMAQIAYSDGTIDESERNLLKRYVIKMGFEKDNTDGIVEFLLDAVKNGYTCEKIIDTINNN